MLSELLPQRQIVVATGGGTFAEPDNRALMLADGAVAWLDVPLSRVFERVPADGRRPLAADRAQMEQLYARRRLAYAEAHVRIDGTRAGARRRRAAARMGWLLMTYLILSDIHANLEALEAVLAAAGRVRPCARARRSGRLRRRPERGDRARARRCPSATFIRGNHDKVAPAWPASSTSTTWRASRFSGRPTR